MGFLATKHMLKVKNKERSSNFFLAVSFPGFGRSAFHPVGWGGEDIRVQLQARVPSSET